MPYGRTAWLPCSPQPARSASVESDSGSPAMKSSSFMRHDAEIAGKVDHWFPSASRDDPSYRTTPVRKYRSAKL